MIFAGKSPSVSWIAPSLLILCGSLLLAGCGDKKADKAASQTAAKVNRSEITVHQINFLLQQRRVTPDQASAAGKEALERLIDQELMLQKAAELKIDRDVKVMQQIEVARRDIVARAYLERIVNGVAEPTPEEIHAYYEKNPLLFKERKIYNFQEFTIQSTPEQGDALRTALAGAKNSQAFTDYLKNKGFRFSSSQASKAAEQVPLANLAGYAKLKDGQSVSNPIPGGVQVLMLSNTQNQPVEEAQARPAIEQFLLNERKRKMIDDDVAYLKSAAKIEYLGEYVKTKKSELPESASDTK
jgi:EpsD family peptidyl-prolyl cis-trans isomerase